MNIKVKEVKPLDDLKLDVLFTNGIRKIYDVKKAMSYYEPFKELEDNPYLFKQAKADCGGCAVCWNDEIDVTEWELWEMGEKVITDPKQILKYLYFIFTNIIIFVIIFIVRRVIHEKLFIKADNCDFRKRRLV